jgi:hypothetical protein
MIHAQGVGGVGRCRSKHVSVVLFQLTLQNRSTQPVEFEFFSSRVICENR